MSRPGRTGGIRPRASIRASATCRALSAVDVPEYRTHSVLKAVTSGS